MGPLINTHRHSQAPKKRQRKVCQLTAVQLFKETSLRKINSHLERELPGGRNLRLWLWDKLKQTIIFADARGAKSQSCRVKNVASGRGEGPLSSSRLEPR